MIDAVQWVSTTTTTEKIHPRCDTTILHQRQRQRQHPPLS
jgi:hypothetical protein